MIKKECLGGELRKDNDCQRKQWSCRWEDNKTSLIYVEDNCIFLSWIWFPLSPLFFSVGLRVWSTLLSPAILTLTSLALYHHWLGANDLSPKLRGRWANHYSSISLISEKGNCMWSILSNETWGADCWGLGLLVRFLTFLKDTRGKRGSTPQTLPIDDLH